MKDIFEDSDFGDTAGYGVVVDLAECTLYSTHIHFTRHGIGKRPIT